MMNNPSEKQTMQASDEVFGSRRPAIIEDEEQEQVIGVNVLQNAPDPRMVRTLGKSF